MSKSVIIYNPVMAIEDYLKNNLPKKELTKVQLFLLDLENLDPQLYDQLCQEYAKFEV